MAYGVLPFGEFPGLDLVSAPDQSGCVDLLNVDFDQRGAVRQRDGYTNFTTAEAAATYDCLGVYRGANQLAAGRGTSIDFIDTAGAVVASGTFATAPRTFANFGSPTASYLYIAGPGATVRRWDGAALTAPAGMPSAYHLAVQAVENRLVAAKDATNISRVWFSDAGLPETWAAANYVDLTPGDGEGIQGLIAWREMVIAFKKTKFFVFYGNSTSATGTTVFNYRTVDAGVGLSSTEAVCATPDGVYFFMDGRGIYRTTGGLPQLVSQAVTPVFRGSGASSFWQGGVAYNPNPNASMAWWNDRLYFAYSRSAAVSASSPNDRVLVFDPQADRWTVYDWFTGGMVPFAPSTNGDELMFARGATANRIARHRNVSPLTDDAGSAITSRWRSGFYDFGRTNEKVVRETELWGTGTVGMALSKDFGALDTAANVTLGASPAIARGAHLVSKKGTLFSFQIASVSGGAWAVHRLAHNLQGDRPIGQR